MHYRAIIQAWIRIAIVFVSILLPSLAQAQREIFRDTVNVSLQLEAKDSLAIQKWSGNKYLIVGLVPREYDRFDTENCPTNNSFVALETYKNREWLRWYPRYYHNLKHSPKPGGTFKKRQVLNMYDTYEANLSLKADTSQPWGKGGKFNFTVQARSKPSRSQGKIRGKRHLKLYFIHDGMYYELCNLAAHHSF